MVEVSKNLTWQRENINVDVFRDGLILALVHSGVCITLQNFEGDYLFAANMPKKWGELLGDDPVDSQIFGGQLGEQVSALKHAALSTGELQRIDVITTDQQEFEFVIDPILSADQQITLVTTIIDQTEERKREKIHRALLRELSHRTKNMLAIVLSLATQTAKNSSDLPSFLKRFRGRVYSLSASQDLIIDKNWKGAHADDVFTQQLAKYFDNPKEIISTTGDNVVLSPNAALHLGLAVHELVVDLVKVQLATKSTERVDTSSTRKINDDGSISIVLEWRQTNGDLLSLDDDHGFNRSLLSRIVPTAVGGSATLNIENGTLVYRLEYADDT